MRYDANEFFSAERQSIDYADVLRQLRRVGVETGSLVCLGCGREHSCSTRGCAILRKAATALETLLDHPTAELYAQAAQERDALRAENRRLLEQINRLTGALAGGGGA